MTSASLSIASNASGRRSSRLTSRVMCLSSISRRSRLRDGVDELLAVEDAGDVLVVEDPLDPGQPERGAGDHHRLGGAAGAAPGRRP